MAKRSSHAGRAHDLIFCPLAPVKGFKMDKETQPPSASDDDDDDDGAEEYFYCRYRRCGKRLLDAHAYGFKAWRLPVRRKKEDRS